MSLKVSCAFPSRRADCLMLRGSAESGAEDAQALWWE